MKLKALVIDDSRVMRSMVMQALNKARLAEFEFTEAEDGADALAKFDPATYDIAFVDWNMPNMTGVDFVRQARAKGGTGHIPMVMVTSEKTVAKIEEALTSAGANAYICKPFTPDEMQVKLLKIIDQVLEYKKPKEAGGGLLSKLFG